ncbi:MAG: hypothetical protein MUP09_11010, partial [Thiovulaceae bacterium]|nr:hypothetical protein [Sulfurimonadaceae bacterium]
MLSILIRWGVGLLLAYASLSGADRNETLINAGSKSYDALLKSIEKANVINDETALQKVLLEKLLNMDLNASSPAAPLQTPISTDAYGDLFQRYLSDAEKKAVLSIKLQPIKIRIETLEEEIKDSENNSSSLMTLQLQDAF